MKKIKKQYIEFLLPGLAINETKIEEINHNNPDLVPLDDEKIMGFRFFDKKFIIDENKEYEGSIENVTNWYYIGKNVTIKEIEKYFENNKDRIQYDGLDAVHVSPKINLYSLNNIDNFCMTRCGILIPITKDNVILDKEILSKERILKNLKIYKKLENHLGKYVTCQRFENGILYSYVGRLQMIKPNDKIILSNIQMPFIDYESCIFSIVKGKEGEELYQNPYLEKSYNTVPIEREISHKNDYNLLSKNEEEGYKIIPKKGIAKKRIFSKR